MTPPLSWLNVIPASAAFIVVETPDWRSIACWIINQIKINISEANAYFPDEIASMVFDM
jgi:hypothetical protein